MKIDCTIFVVEDKENDCRSAVELTLEGKPQRVSDVMKTLEKNFGVENIR